MLSRFYQQECEILWNQKAFQDSNLFGQFVSTLPNISFTLLSVDCQPLLFYRNQNLCSTLVCVMGRARISGELSRDFVHNFVLIPIDSSNFAVKSERFSFTK